MESHTVENHRTTYREMCKRGKDRADPSNGSPLATFLARCAILYFIFVQFHHAVSRELSGLAELATTSVHTKSLDSPFGPSSGTDVHHATPKGTYRGVDIPPSLFQHEIKSRKKNDTTNKWMGRHIL
jgi:hypothetical protein